MNKLDIIKSFEQKKILLIGDTILDVYVYGKAVCQDPDSSVIEAEETDVVVSFGGAGLVASNILELGGQVTFFSVVGEDRDAEHYNSFIHPNLNKIFLIDKNRKTTVKKRFLVDGKKSLRLNQVDNRDIDSILEKELITSIEPFIKDIDLMVIADNQHGLLTKNLISRLIEFSHRYQKPLYVDSQIGHKPSNHNFYKGVDCLFLNEKEAEAVSPNFNIRELKEKLGVVNVVIKLGPKGSTALFNDKYIKSSSCRVKSIDPCGAGDAFLAAFSLGDREMPEESLIISNIWAAISTTIKGTEIPKKQDLGNIIKSWPK